MRSSVSIAIQRGLNTVLAGTNVAPDGAIAPMSHNHNGQWCFYVWRGLDPERPNWSIVNEAAFQFVET